MQPPMAAGRTVLVARHANLKGNSHTALERVRRLGFCCTRPMGATICARSLRRRLLFFLNQIVIDVEQVAIIPEWRR